jgi:putative transposase
VDYSTLNRWVSNYAPEFEKAFRRWQRPVGRSWRLDETYVKSQGKWASLYRAVDKESYTIDFLFTPQRDRAAAEAFLRKAMRQPGLPEKIRVDQSGSTTAASKRDNRAYKTVIVIQPSKDLNNVVEQDHRVVKRGVRPRFGVKSCWSARGTLAGIEVMHRITKGHLGGRDRRAQTAAEQFYALAA